MHHSLPSSSLPRKNYTKREGLSHGSDQSPVPRQHAPQAPRSTQSTGLFKRASEGTAILAIFFIKMGIQRGRGDRKFQSYLNLEALADITVAPLTFLERSIQRKPLKANAVSFSFWAPFSVEMSLNNVRHFGPCNFFHSLPIQQLQEARIGVHVDPYRKEHAIIFSCGIRMRRKQWLFHF